MLSVTRYLRWQLLATVVAIVAGYLYGGATAAAAVALLGVFEVSLSFDNAIVNAAVMRRMSQFWKTAFLWIGVPIAAIGMRFAFPIIIVSLTSGLSMTQVLHLAFNDASSYQRHLEAAAIQINTLGGTFLLLVFLGFFLDPEDGQVPWLGYLERPLARVGKIDTIAIGITLVVLFVDSRLVAADQRSSMLLSGVLAVCIYIFVNGFSEVLGNLEGAVKQAGLATFIYLEVLDASFSFDGVIGAFAISNEVIVICLGLGIGALYIRTLTKFFDERGTLAEFVYLGNGAHWAVGALAAILLIKNTNEVPEVVTGLVGVSIIAAAFWASVRVRRDEGGRGGSLGPTGEHLGRRPRVDDDPEDAAVVQRGAIREHRGDPTG